MDNKRFVATTHTTLAHHDPGYTGTYGKGKKDKAQKKLADDVKKLVKLQDVLWASRTYRVLLIFQAMDGAGKDSAIKYVMRGVNPQGCWVRSFRAPTNEELRHPFLFRPMQALPKAGEIAIFNRSYYEETLVVRVHREFLKAQKKVLTPEERTANVWEYRFHIINEFEKWLAHDPSCPTLIFKFFLHVSKEEQKKRFLDRINDPKKNWKFKMQDVREREYWDVYMYAYEEMLRATSMPWAPWFIIPADNKWLTHMVIADIITDRLETLGLTYPEISSTERQELESAKELLESGKI